MIRQTYRLAAEACAEIMWRVPALERSFVRIGPRAVATPGVRLFYRSAAYRLGQRFRTNETQFRYVNIAERPLLFDVTEFTTGPLYFGGALYEPETTHCFVDMLRPGHVFVDIGANHGYFTVLAAALIGATGRVFAFEPNPQVFAQLQTHVRLNAFESFVTLESCALSDRDGATARLYVSQTETNSGLSSLTPHADLIGAGALSESGTISVKLETFDRWLAGKRLDHIDLVKMDVEGAEALVIGGMTEALRARAIRALIVETVWGGTAHAMLCEAGYRARPLDPIGSLTNILFVRAEDAG